MQADVFRAQVVPMKNEQGPGMGAAMIAAVGCGWFGSLAECASSFIQYGSPYEPKSDNAAKYAELFEIYKDVYVQTRVLNERLQSYRV
jgi:xylulokinase